jgi:S-adenosyl-L-methionine hydrolase (adenosine-forming)
MAPSYRRPVTTPAAARAARARSTADVPVPPFISLLTDFGERDPSAAICRGIILGIAPHARLVDISHAVDKYQIRDGALLLWCALPYLPVGVHIAVVDPGVGTARRPVALAVARGDILVGPDNGLLIPAAERLGGVRAARLLEAQAYRLPVVSSSFHGRDVFAPAGAHLASGTPLNALGPALDPTSLVPLAWPRPRVRGDRLEVEVIYVDTFGNVKLAGGPADLERAVGPLRQGTILDVSWSDPAARIMAERVPWADTFGSVAAGALLLYADSYGRLCLAQNQGSAAAQLGVTPDLKLRIRPAAP